MKTGRKSYGEEFKIMERYSDLSESYFGFIKDKIQNGTDDEKWRSVQVLKGAFEKMIPQTIDGDITNKNINTDIECTPAEYDAIKQAILKSVQDPGSQE